MVLLAAIALLVLVRQGDAVWRWVWGLLSFNSDSGSNESLDGHFLFPLLNDVALSGV